MKKYLSIFVVLMIVAPSVAFASWWNPFSWSIFNRIFNKTEVVESRVKEPVANLIDVSSSTGSQMLIQEDTEQKRLQTENDKLRAENEIAKQKLETAKVQAEKARLQAENDKLKADALVVKQVQTEASKGFLCNGTHVSISCPTGKVLKCSTEVGAQCVSDSDVLCNGKYWAQCQSGQVFVCPTSGNATCSTPQPTQKSYYVDLLSKLTASIAIYESYISFLEDTIKQERDVVFAISSKPYTGGMVGETRSACLDLINAYISINTSSISSGKQQLAKIKTVKEYLTAESNQFVSKADYDKVQTVEVVKNDISTVEVRINEGLQESLDCLKY